MFVPRANLPQRRRFPAVSPVSPAYHALSIGTRLYEIPGAHNRHVSLIVQFCCLLPHKTAAAPFLVQSCGFACRARDIGTARWGKGYFRSHHFELRCFNNGIRVEERETDYLCAPFIVQSRGFACHARDIDARPPAGERGIFVHIISNYVVLTTEFMWRNAKRLSPCAVRLGSLGVPSPRAMSRNVMRYRAPIARLSRVIRRPFARLIARCAARGVYRPTARIRMRGTRGRTARRSPSGGCASRGSPKRRPPPRLPPPPRGNIRPPDR